MKHWIAPLLLAAACVAQAQVTPVQVERPWARATVQGQMASGAFMTLTAREPLTLTGAQSPAAGIVEIHQMKMVGDVMKMSPVESLPLKAGEPLNFAPGGYHFMLMDLKAPLRAGTAIPLTLRFQDAQGAPRTLDVSVPVQLAMPAPMHGHK
jgi:copper(I)-binding protein